MFRRHSLNAAEPRAREPSGPQDPAEETKRPEQKEQHRRHLLRVHRRNSKSIGARQRDNPVRRVRTKVSLHKIRHRGTMNRYSLARRRLWVQLSKTNLVEVLRPDHISRLRLRLVQDKRMKQAPNEKECRALTLSSRRKSSSANRSNEAARLLQPITARDTGSRKVDVNKDTPDRRHLPGSNNFVASNTSRSGRKFRSRFVV